ncbi:MAG: hypothetical protein LBC83_05560 [Oscillospiraceae bacterium]|jgi:hypothetical protein|nr:hypothetical protein [Oscillospiraceae bacterium]
MIGLGSWKFKVDTMFYKGDAILTVGDNGGKYSVDIEITDVDIPPITVFGIEEEDDTISGTATTDLLKGKEIPFSITFEGDVANGYLKVPFLGRVKLENGIKMGA